MSFDYKNHCEELIDKMDTVMNTEPLNEFERAFRITVLADELVDSAQSWQLQTRDGKE